MYYYYPYYHYPRYVPEFYYRQFPPIDIHQLDVSVHKFQQLMKQAHLLVDRLAEDPEFAKALMRAAQQSNENEVNRLIRSTGVTIKVTTTFTPTGIRIILDNSGEGDCCDLLIALRW